MQLTFLGGADEVGASSTLIEMGGKRILVDTGIRISARSNRGIQNDQLPDLYPISAAGGPDYILVTHAHTDHTGALPLVVEQYPHVPVLATRPTIALTRILQADAQRIMKSRQEEEGELPIFDEIASSRLLEAFQQVEFNQPVKLGEALQVTYHVAGHIAGAAALVLEGEDGVLVMSGDVSLNDQRAVLPMKVPRVKADALVLESTYGGRLHANRLAEERRLIETLRSITERGGKALIPAFALGRAQEILQILLAYRDLLDVPVYADGMVRAVCRGYVGFADLLPEKTVRAAGDDQLFFRGKIKPVDSAVMREQLAHDPTPCVIVASSGMLTGGASTVYARAMASDPRHAILLTGYQDEEAPGRVLQRMVKERQEGEEAAIKLDGRTVTVRCQVDMYSLSAHADEAELVSVAEALDADEIMLVHGDPGARHSLATALRQRERRVTSPKIGQTVVINAPPRPWALGRVGTQHGVTSGSETQPLDPRALWDSLLSKGQAGSYFSARELAQMWWGDAERGREAQHALKDSIHFAADWRRADTFQVRTAEQVTRAQRQRAIMLANPDLVGKLVVLRDSNNRPRAGVVLSGGIDSFEADVHNARGRQYPADALLWVLGNWDGYSEGVGKKGQVGAMLQAVKPLQDHFLPLHLRQQLVAAAQPVNPEALLPPPDDALPEGITRQMALLAVVWALAGDGATLEPGGLLPRRALQDGPMEQNQARETAFSLMPSEARLRKVGMETHRKRITLSFDFPERARTLYAEEIEQIEEQTGWDVLVKQEVNQQALGAAVDELLPEGARLVKGPSFYLDRREVLVEVTGADDLPALEQDYFNLTGFRLRTAAAKDSGGSAPAAVSAPAGRARMEINAAYAAIKDVLDSKGLYKTSLKQDQIVLTFISPQVGERCRAEIARLAEETGYTLSIHPHPNQQQILQVASNLLRVAGWQVRKGPGIHTDRGEISVKVAEQPSDTEIRLVSSELNAQTGYTLIVSV